VKTLREWRAERLLSVRALAVAAGVSTKTITELEYGRQLPTFRTIRRVAAALAVEPRDVAEFAAAMDQAGEGGKVAA
jgi:transcriptional regulator with XRE-family HTH domain